MCVEEMTRLCLHKLLYLGDDAQICVCPINGQYVGLQRVCVQQVCLCVLCRYGNILCCFSVQKSGGTQLKLVMSFPNYGQAMFKPMK